MRHKTLLCNCNRTMKMDGKTIAAALGESGEPRVHDALCRQHVAAFEAAVKSGDDLLVACTQESRLFTELASQTPGAQAPIRFVNIRETGGWSRDAKDAGPKIAALLALAHLSEPEPVATVSYQSAGRLLIIGELDADTPLYMAQAIFPLLVNAPTKKFVIIGDASHVMLTEKNRMQLFREVDLFFAEGRPT